LLVQSLAEWEFRQELGVEGVAVVSLAGQSRGEGAGHVLCTYVMLGAVGLLAKTTVKLDGQL